VKISQTCTISLTFKTYEPMYGMIKMKYALKGSKEFHGILPMNKTVLVSQVVQTSKFTQKEAAKAVDPVFITVLEALKNGDTV